MTTAPRPPHRIGKMMADAMRAALEECIKDGALSIVIVAKMDDGDPRLVAVPDTRANKRGLMELGMEMLR